MLRFKVNIRRSYQSGCNNNEHNFLSRANMENGGRQTVFGNATMQNRFRELDIFSFSLSEDVIPITDSRTSDHFRLNSSLAEKIKKVFLR